LKTNSSFTDAGDYVEAVHRIHRTRAIGLLNIDRIEEARREILLAHAAVVGDADLLEKALPKLIEAGYAAEAERLFSEGYATYEAVTQDFPASARHHNALAWLAARCDRRLDDALLHAREAVRLAPDRPANLDTLAEVHFRLGNQREALAWESKAVEQEPRNPHFQQQLRRFQQAQ
jgi:tetratricopeptide (TPR) repeat protein